MARPHKGERVPVTARIPASYSSKLERWKDATGESKNDLVQRLVCDFLDQNDPTQNSAQEALDLAQTA
jgi:hypothetical protein